MRAMKIGFGIAVIGCLVASVYAPFVARPAGAVSGITSGGSIVYVAANNVWLTSPDGVTRQQVTTDGTAEYPYEQPSMTGDGSVWAVRDQGYFYAGRSHRRSSLFHFGRSGALLNTPFAPPQIEGSDSSSVQSAFGITEAVVSPDGTKIAYTTSAWCSDGAGDRMCEWSQVVRTDGTFVASDAPGDLLSWANPSWMNDSRLLLDYQGNHVGYYDLGAGGPPVNWIGYGDDWYDTDFDYFPSRRSSEGFFEPARVMGRSQQIGRGRELWFFTGGPPGPATDHCYVGDPAGDFRDPSFAADGRAAVWEETNEGLWITPVGDLAASCSSLTPQLLIPGGSAPDWGPVALDPPRLTITDAIITESDPGQGELLDFTLQLDRATSSAVRVNYTTVDGTAKAGVDYHALSGVASIAAGATTGLLRVQVPGDALDEADERLALVLSNPVGATLADTKGVGTIIDNDTMPSLTVGDAQVDEGGTAQFTVSLSAPSGRKVTVAYATSVGKATTADFTSRSGRIGFAAGATSATIAVTTTEDALDEADERFSVVLSSQVNATLADYRGVGTIVDDDPLPTITIDDFFLVEADQVVDVNVHLSAPSGRTVSVAFTTTPGTATSDVDYVARSGRVTFRPGQTSRTISITVKDDFRGNEGDETFFVDLSAPASAVITDARGQGTIRDNERSAE